MSLTKQQMKDKMLPILEKGKPINDIIFMSRKMTYDDIVFGLWFCRPLGVNPIKKWFGFGTKRVDNNYTGMDDEPLNNMLCNPIFGGDYVCQLIFGCIAALEVYTESEILTVLDLQKEYGRRYG